MNSLAVPRKFLSTSNGSCSAEGDLECVWSAQTTETETVTVNQLATTGSDTGATFGRGGKHTVVWVVSRHCVCTSVVCGVVVYQETASNRLSPAIWPSLNAVTQVTPLPMSVA